MKKVFAQTTHSKMYHMMINGGLYLSMTNI